MDFLTATLYGVIQGISEFLPISSSGHLTLLPYFIKIPPPGVFFDLAMHGGTALAIMAYFSSDLIKILKSLFAENKAYIINCFLATLASVLLILPLMGVAKEMRSPVVVMMNQIVFGLILFFADLYQRRHPKKFPFETAVLYKAVIMIGLAQAVAIFPGVSRSGITLSMALFLGVSKYEGGRFSFLLSLPLIFAGLILEGYSVYQGGAGQVSLFPTLWGVVVSFLVGLMTIHFFLKIFSRVSFLWFTLYRLAIGLVIGLLIVW